MGWVQGMKENKNGSITIFIHKIKDGGMRTPADALECAAVALRECQNGDLDMDECFNRGYEHTFIDC